MKKKSFLKLKKRLRVSPWELIVAGLFAVVLLGFLYFTRSQNNWVKIEVKVSPGFWWQGSLADPPVWFWSNLEPGMKEYTSSGEEVARLLDVYVAEGFDDDNLDSGTTRGDVYLTVDLKVKKEMRSGKIKYLNRLVAVGSDLELFLGGTEIPCLVTEVEREGDLAREEFVIVEAKWIGVADFFAKELKEGALMEGLNGKPLAQVLTKEIFPAEMVVTNDRGDLLIRYHPLKKDVYLRLKLLVKKRRDDLFFRYDQKLKPGRRLNIILENLDMIEVLVLKVFKETGEPIY